MRTREFNRPRRDIVVIMHNIRSIQNVGAILRTAECLGVLRVYATGYTANLTHRTDGSNLPLLPHVQQRLVREIHRSALGAEELVDFVHRGNLDRLLDELKADGYTVVGLEQADRAIPLPDFHPSHRIALLLGEEVNGLTLGLINACDQLIEIPMFGAKESYNVSVATGIALYSLVMS